LYLIILTTGQYIAVFQRDFIANNTLSTFQYSSPSQIYPIIPSTTVYRPLFASFFAFPPFFELLLNLFFSSFA
jgi:hypothetical protein